MPLYRFVTLPLRHPVGPWRDNRSVAVADALSAGLAHRDEADPSKLWWDPRAELEERQDAAPAVEAAP